MFSIINLSQDSSKYSKYLSTTLIEQIEKNLKLWEKVLIYLNKRGSHSTSVCKNCGHIWMCPNCDVSMHVHKAEKKLICHICSKDISIPYKCPKCNGIEIEFVWVGTQHIEEILKDIFPKQYIYRFDSDALSKVSQKKEALNSLEKANIIIGTKMLTTWFNFQKVWSIAIILVEWELQSPWYDTEEKAYQNLRQLIGRWNRLWQSTQILLQTFSPNQRLIIRLTEKSMKEILSESLNERKKYHYPPYFEIAILNYQDISKKNAIDTINKLVEKLKKQQYKEEIQVLYEENTFKKNNTYHTNAIIKWKSVRQYIACIKSDIMKNPKLSVQFSD